MGRRLVVVCALTMAVGCASAPPAIIFRSLVPAAQIETPSEEVVDLEGLSFLGLCYQMCERMQRCSRTGAVCIDNLCTSEPTVCLVETEAFFACITVLPCDAPAGLCAPFANVVLDCLDTVEMQQESL